MKLTLTLALAHFLMGAYCAGTALSQLVTWSLSWLAGCAAFLGAAWRHP